MNIRNLQVGDTVTSKISSDKGTEYVVKENILDDVLFLWSESKQRELHIFYDDEEDLKFAKLKFDLED